MGIKSRISIDIESKTVEDELVTYGKSLIKLKPKKYLWEYLGKFTLLHISFYSLTWENSKDIRLEGVLFTKFTLKCDLKGYVVLVIHSA